MRAPLAAPSFALDPKRLTVSLLAACLAAAGCGGPSPRTTLPDESRDFNPIAAAVPSQWLPGTQPVGPDIGGSQWEWIEAECTEGTPDLAESGFAATARVVTDASGLLLVYDERVETIGCDRTVIQRAVPGQGEDAAWSFREIARIALPSDAACTGRPEADRPGDVRLRGQHLEVFIQRSVLCNGLEVRMVWAPVQPTPLSDQELIRHYLAEFSRMDAEAVAALFAEGGSLLEPFNRTETGGPTRHDGRPAIQAWYADAFGNVPWLAIRPLTIRAGEIENQYVVEWEYMDPRLEAPFAGRNLFTVAAGEIFEAEVAITQERVEAIPQP
ncbi:MAG: nuclear transport factor 2 family protein [Myxococcales bacterium]|nr:nuclear transport factor 2 family protein [Myxococcales bacterium]